MLNFNLISNQILITLGNQNLFLNVLYLNNKTNNKNITRLNFIVKSIILQKSIHTYTHINWYIIKIRN